MVSTATYIEYLKHTTGKKLVKVFLRGEDLEKWLNENIKERIDNTIIIWDDMQFQSMSKVTTEKTWEELDKAWKESIERVNKKIIELKRLNRIVN